MLQPSYKRSLDKNYLILEGSQENSNNYQLTMLTENHIPGVLDFEKRQIDDRIYYYYDISGKQTVKSVFAKRMLSYEDIKTILLELHSIIQQTNSYLIHKNYMVLDPAYMYCDYECKSLTLLFYIDYEMEEKNPFIGLGEYLLERLDHQEERAVAVGYQLYQEVRRDNFTFEQFLGIVEEVNRETLEVERAKQAIEVEETPEYGQGESHMSVSDENIVFPSGRKEEEEERVQSRFVPYLIKVVVLAGVFLGVAIYMELNMPQYDMEKFLFYGLAVLVVVGGITHYYVRKGKNHSSVELPTRQEQHWEKKSIPREQTKSLPKERKVSTMTPQVQESSYEHTIYMGNMRSEERILIGSVNQKDIRMVLESFPITLGKSRDHADVVIDHPSISRLHARIVEGADGLYIEDLNSVNGTYKNGVILETNECVRLEVKDELQFGSVCLEYR